jgi:hypothetical protein
MKHIHEVFFEFDAAKNTEERRQVLLKNNSRLLLKTLKLMFDDFYFALGKVPKYIPDDSPEGYTLTNLHKRLSEFEVFLDESYVINYRSEHRFIQFLESLHHQESEIVVKIINKKMKVKWLTRRLVDEVFPNLLD